MSSSIMGKLDDVTTDMMTSSDAMEPWEDPSLPYSIISYYVTGIIGFIGNSLVIVVIATSKKMRKKPTNWFLVQQSVLDAGGSLAMLAIAGTLGRAARFRGAGGWMRCLFLESGYLMWTFYMASTYNLVVITVDRYFEVVHAIYHKNNFTRKVFVILLVIPWVVSLLYNCTGAGYARVVDGSCLLFMFAHAWEGVVLGWATFLMQFFIPLVIMIYCYSVMAHYLIKMSRAVKSSSAKDGKSVNKATLNVVKTLFIVAACFVICWAWNSVYFLFVTMGYVADFTGVFFHFTVTAVNVNCIANPFIYALKYKEFKQALYSMFCSKLRKVGITSTTGTSGTTNTN